ncbi:MAG: hypothetical protein MI924_38575 [Chloroflexales bacterium]|nr:hypothetical protein [Chloroflexales bacterium]
MLRLMQGTVDVFLTSDQNRRNQHNLTFAALTETYGHLRAMGETARRCLVRLRELWPPETYTMPLYPAFQPAT